MSNNFYVINDSTGECEGFEAKSDAIERAVVLANQFPRVDMIIGESVSRVVCNVSEPIVRDVA